MSMCRQASWSAMIPALMRYGCAPRRHSVAGPAIVLAVLLVAGWPSAGAAQPCAGDCDGDDTVNISELITIYGIVLQGSSAAACPAADVDGSDTLTVDELVAATGNAQDGCGAHPVRAIPEHACADQGFRRRLGLVRDAGRVHRDAAHHGRECGGHAKRYQLRSPDAVRRVRRQSSDRQERELFLPSPWLHAGSRLRRSARAGGVVVQPGSDPRRVPALYVYGGHQRAGWNLCTGQQRSGRRHPRRPADSRCRHGWRHHRLQRSAASFVTFESGQVRPLALSPDGTRLFAVNTPDNRLEIFDVDGGGLTHAGSVPVGLEPVAVAARTDGEVWVVNHLSDSVSIVDVAATPPRVVRTLLVGDEPRDIVFAGPGGNRAFITTARRGQNCPRRCRRCSPRRASAARAGLGLRRHRPRRRRSAARRSRSSSCSATRRARSPRAPTAARSTRRSSTPATRPRPSPKARCATTAISTTTPSRAVQRRRRHHAGRPARPRARTSTASTRPEVGLIVKFNPSTDRWEDELGRNWNNAVRFNLPDHDVFAIDADADPPGRRPAAFASVGTVLFNMVVNPVERQGLRHQHRGAQRGALRGPRHPRRHAPCAATCTRRASPCSTAPSVLPRHLNKHIDYDVVPSPPGVEGRQPRDAARHGGHAATARRSTSPPSARARSASSTPRALEDDTFVPDAADHIDGERRRAERPGARRGAATGSTCSPASTTSISVIDTATARRDRPPRRCTIPSRRSVVDGPAVPLRRALHLEQRRGVVRELPHLRRLRQPGLGPRQSGRRRARQPEPVPRRRSARHVVPGLPSAEGADDDAEPARHGEPRPDALARRPHRRQRPGRRRARRGRGVQEVQRRLRRACSAATGRSPTREMQAFTDFILAGHLSAQPDPRARQLAHRRRSRPGATSSSTRSVRRLPDLQRLPRARPGAGLLRQRRLLELRERDRRSSRSRTCATCTRRSACSACRRSPFINPGDNGHKGDQVRGFGFLHDGSIDTVFRFHNATRLQPDQPRRLPDPQPGRLPERRRPAIRSAARSKRSCSPSTATWRRSSASR